MSSPRFWPPCLAPDLALCFVSFFVCTIVTFFLGFGVQPSSTNTPSRTICRTEIACEHTPRASSIACAQLPRPQSPDAGNAPGSLPLIERRRWLKASSFKDTKGHILTRHVMSSRDNLQPRCDRTFAHDGVGVCRMHYFLTSHQEAI